MCKAAVLVALAAGRCSSFTEAQSASASKPPEPPPAQGQASTPNQPRGDQPPKGGPPAPGQAEPTQSDPSKAGPGPPRSTQRTVLFERHDPQATGSVPDSPDDGTAPPDAQATPSDGSAGVSSSSSRNRRSLQRRSPAAGSSRSAPESPVQGPPLGSPAAQTSDPDQLSSTFTASSSAQMVATAPALDTKAAASISDAERLAPVITSTELDVHVNRDSAQMDARARITIRNSSSTPLTRVVLQISSALRWESASLITPAGSQRLSFQQHALTTDADHTGTAAELSFNLPQALASGATASFDLFYGGTLTSSAERLLRLGAPAGKAAAADWDQVSPEFAGLRGFGNVLWYPVAAGPASLADGEAFTLAVNEQRRRSLGSLFSMRLTLETSGPAPAAAFLNGRRAPLAEVRGAGGSSAGTAASTILPTAPGKESEQPESSGEAQARLYTAAWPSAPVIGHLPSLFLGAHAFGQEAGDNAPVHVSTTDPAAAARYTTAARRLQPFLNEWLGPHRSSVLDLLELPAGATQPFVDGALFVTSFPDAATTLTETAGASNALDAELAASLVYPLASAAVPAGAAPWLAQGLPEFLRLVYLERQEGRKRALAVLTAGVGGLQQAEASPASPLNSCVDAACARTKSAFVLMMLRQLAGDDALKAALPTLLADAAGASPNVSAALLNTLQRVTGKDLRWFFTDWYDRDAGLPELTIVTVAPRLIERGSVHTVVPAERRPVGGPVGDEPVAQPGGPLDQERPTVASRNKVALPDGSWLVAVEVQNAGDAAAEVSVTVRSGTLQNTLPLRVPAHSRATIRVPFETSPEEVVVNDGTTPEQRGTTHRRRIELPTQYR